MGSIITIIIALLRVFFPALAAASKPTAEAGDPDIETRDALRKRIRETWGTE